MTVRLPLVGIAVPVRNAERWLDQMLESVRNQTYRDWRLVIVDDASDDGSLDIARQHEQSDPRIRATSGSEVSRGAPLTRAHGRALLGDDPVYLYFPDADDLLEPDLLNSLVTRLESDPLAVAVFCRYTRIDEAGLQLDESPPQRIAMSPHWARRLPDGEARTPFESIYGWAAPAMEPVTMFRADAYDRAGGWEGWADQFGESIDLLCRLALSGSVMFEPSPLYRYRRHPGQFTANGANLGDTPLAIRKSWRERAAHDSSLRPVVEAAEFFIEHRLTPRLGLEAAWQHVRAGHPMAAARFLGGAVRRYRWRAFPESP